MFFHVGLADLKAIFMLIETTVLITCSWVALNSLFNLFLLRRIGEAETSVSQEIAVLLPVRNESENLSELFDSLARQTGVDQISFHFIDDNSEDRTFELLSKQSNSDSRFITHSGLELPAGWKGKPFALQQGYSASKSEIVIVIDADVRLSPSAISSAVAKMLQLNLDFLSAYPQQIAISWPERLIQPLLQWSWISTVPLRIAEKSINPAFAVANGQFFIVKRTALEASGGFESIKNEVLDDMALARALLRAKYRGTVADASQVAFCRMYSSWAGVRNGYGKSLRVVFRTPIGFVITSNFLVFTGILPSILTMRGSFVGLMALLMILTSRVISASRSGGRIRDSFLHPISVLMLLYLIAYSIVMKRKIAWKGRIV